MIKQILVFGIMALTLGSCQSRAINENFDYGKIVNGSYQNDFFKISITIPKDWKVQSKEALEQLQKRGEAVISGGNKNLQAQIKASEVNTANLFMTSKFEMVSPVDFNPTFILIAENIKGLPGIKDGKDYLFHAKKMLKQTNLNYDFSEDIDRVNLGGQLFYVLTAKIMAGGKSIEQQYIATVLNGFSLTMILTYSTDAEKDELKKMMDSYKKI